MYVCCAQVRTLHSGYSELPDGNLRCTFHGTFCQYRSFDDRIAGDKGLERPLARHIVSPRSPGSAQQDSHGYALVCKAICDKDASANYLACFVVVCQT